MNTFLKILTWPEFWMGFVILGSFATMVIIGVRAIHKSYDE